MTDGILLIGYGTRKGNLTEVLEKQAARLRASTCYEIGIAYFRVSSPSIPEAVRGMVSRGVDRIAAVPYYVAEGKLTNELIPEKLGLGKNVRAGKIKCSGKEVSVFLTEAFNFDPCVTDIVCDRIAEAGGTRESGILVLGHGTRDPSLMNREVVSKNAERLRKRGYSRTAFAFNEFCEPSVKDSLDRLIGLGAEELVCIPLFVAMGLHLGEEIPEQIGIPAYSSGGEITINGKKIKVKYTKPLEDDPRLADLVRSRAEMFLK